MWSETVAIFLRGLAMGAADVVPGVSGGTVAFVTGIYERLLNAIKAVNIGAVRQLWQAGPLAFFRAIDGAFLLPLFAGILTSLFSLARLVTYLLEYQPLLIWSLFFGLIAASSLHMLRQIQRWGLPVLAMLVCGIVLALLVSELKPAELAAEPQWIFVAGFIAICAMILPGISGSFLLVLMGMYGHVLTAVHELQLQVLSLFALGCVSGLLVFSRFLSWLFYRFKNITLALMTGFLIGSLSLVWPWKHTLSFYQNSRGKQMALEQINVLPESYQQLSGAPSQLMACIAMMALGLLVVALLEWLSTKIDHSS